MTATFKTLLQRLRKHRLLIASRKTATFHRQHNPLEPLMGETATRLVRDALFLPGCLWDLSAALASERILLGNAYSSPKAPISQTAVVFHKTNHKSLEETIICDA
ncbi:hypothetical protein V1264_003047 [Littorina saxatilis]|uniref:Uncharacterized protein n=1 Tax=Littorina saxatilis TaxID=31220 RepID=A0AAN9B4W9_9CAEN